MKRILLAVCCSFLSAHAIAGDVLVVKGTLSLANAGEQKYAESVIRGLGGYLDDLGVDWDTTTDGEAKAGLMGRYPIVILPYNTRIPKSEMAELRSYVGAGGKLFVFYSADAALADLMGFKLGKYLSDEIPKRWCSVRFTADAPTGMPDMFFQESRNIWPVYPASRPAKIIAYWQDSQGARTQHPAIVMGAKGFWMSHILRTDMDDEGKKLMLLEAISTYAPRIEKKAASRYFMQVDQPGAFKSFKAFLSAISKDETKTMVEYLSDRYA
jgi:hypothetical protein